MFAAGCSPENLKEASFNLWQVDGITVTPGDGCATVSWVPQDGKPDPAEYIISWTPDNEEMEAGSRNVAPDIHELMIDNLANDCEYTFGVQASYEDGLSMKVTAAATPKSTRIAASDFRAIAGDGLAVLSWTEPETDLQYSYEIVISSTGTGSRTEKLESGLSRYVAEDLVNGTEYTFGLTCVYGHGNSDTVTASATPGDIQAIITDKTNLKQFELAVFEYNPAYFIKDEVTGVSWDFGDGSTSSEETASHLFTSTGNYTVKITVTYADNSTQDASADITVEPFGWSMASIGTGYLKASNIVFSHDGQTFYAASAACEAADCLTFGSPDDAAIFTLAVQALSNICNSDECLSLIKFLLAALSAAGYTLYLDGTAEGIALELNGAALAGTGTVFDGYQLYTEDNTLRFGRIAG